MTDFCFFFFYKNKMTNYYYYFFFRIVSILTHTHGEMGEGLKETDSGVYPKWPNTQHRL